MGPRFFSKFFKKGEGLEGRQNNERSAGDIYGRCGRDGLAADENIFG